jgi:hypothetical protein
MAVHLAQGTQEVGAVSESPEEQTAADIFDGLGPWVGETTEEILQVLAEARRTGGQRKVPEL